MEDSKDILLMKVNDWKTLKTMLIKTDFYFFSCAVSVLCRELIKQPFGTVLYRFTSIDKSAYKHYSEYP